MNIVYSVIFEGSEMFMLDKENQQNEISKSSEEVVSDTPDTTKTEILNTDTKNKKSKMKASVVFWAIGAVVTLCLAGCTIGIIYHYLDLRDDSSDTKVEATSSTDLSETDASAVSQDSDGTDKYFSITDAATLADTADKKALSTVEIAALVGPATVSVIADISYTDYYGQSYSQSTGSGFIISADGYIVTNNHVVDGATSVQVLIPGDETPIDAVVVGTDTTTDVAVLKVDREDLPYVTLGDSDALQVGELAVAIGNPFGDLAGTVTTGVISALDRSITISNSTYNLLQTDASINSGNSGGPLVNSYGEVIGITNAKVSEGEGIGFAIPINDIKDIIEELINNGYVSGRPIMGIAVTTVDEEASETYGFAQGVYIREITEDGPADGIGLEVGDMIISVDGVEVTASSDIINIRNEHVAGDTIEITATRNGGDPFTVSLTLGEETPS